MDNVPNLRPEQPEPIPANHLPPQNHLLRHAKRWITIIIGGSVLLLGIALLFLPGPAILVIPLGLAILAGELVWARRWLNKVKETLSWGKGEKRQEEEH